MNRNMHPNTYIYRLPLDKIVDQDIMDWLDSFPSMRKAEIVRYALRYYIGQLEDHEIFKLTKSGQDISKEYKKVESLKKRPKVGLLNNLAKNEKPHF